MVYLMHGPDAQNGDWVKRSEVPDYAWPAAFEIPGNGDENTDVGRFYSAFVIEG